ncbi:hypothetical protein C8J57DRAFT_659680 [Mycena rebaudengoi]|nr:hypothetical protein C8J57DRAFT_659680 [Mycena rebaudengoi]
MIWILNSLSLWCSAHVEFTMCYRMYWSQLTGLDNRPRQHLATLIAFLYFMQVEAPGYHSWNTPQCPTSSEPFNFLGRCVACYIP